MIQKFLYSDTEYGWMVFLKQYLYNSSGCGDGGIFMSLKKSCIGEIPIFYQEVFGAWAEFLKKKVSYECADLNQVIQQPLFLNPRVMENEIMLHNGTFMLAGVRQIKDVVYEYVTGFLPARAIVDCIMEWDEDVSKVTVRNMYEKIKRSIPEHWRKTLIHKR